MGQTRTAEVDTADGAMKLFDAEPDGEAVGAVVVVQDAFGVGEYLEGVCTTLAESGYRAVAPHFFHRKGLVAVDRERGMEAVMEAMEGIADQQILTDVDGALAYLRDQGFADRQIGLVGFCFGGRVSFLVAARRPIGAAVGFYGGGIVESRFDHMPALIDAAPTLPTPWLGLFGDDDFSIPVEQVETLRARLDAEAPVDHDVVRYAGAGHGFHSSDGPAYHAEAAADAWGRTLTWFGEHLRPTS